MAGDDEVLAFLNLLVAPSASLGAGKSLALSGWLSDDGGRTFRNDGAVQIHVDHHALWINPADPDHLILGSDGGISASWDGTAHWRMFDNLALGQFYQVSYDMRTPYYVCGGLQDNNPWCGPSNNLSFHGIRNQDWYEVAYGDGFTTIVDPTDSTIVFMHMYMCIFIYTHRCMYGSNYARGESVCVYVCIYIYTCN